MSDPPPLAPAGPHDIISPTRPTLLVYSYNNLNFASGSANPPARSARDQFAASPSYVFDLESDDSDDSDDSLTTL